MKLEEIYTIVSDSIKSYSKKDDCFNTKQVRNRTEIICKTVLYLTCVIFLRNTREFHAL